MPRTTPSTTAAPKSTQTVFELVAAAPFLSDFLACVMMLPHLFLDAPSLGPFTLFAPDNGAFSKLGPPGTLDTILDNSGLLAKMLAARRGAGKINRAWVLFLISPARLHVRPIRVLRTCRRANEISIWPPLTVYWAVIGNRRTL